MASSTLRTNLVFFSLTCGSLAFGMHLTRDRNSPYLGQKAVALPPFLTVRNQHLWSSQQVFLNSNGVKVMLVPILPVAEKMFYHDVAREIQLTNAVALMEASPLLSIPTSGPTENENQSKDDSLFDSTAGGVKITFGDTTDSEQGKSEFVDYGSSSQEVTQTATLLGGVITTPGYFVDLIGRLAPDRLIKVNLTTPTPISGSLFRYPPLAPENKDVIMLAIETQEKRMLGRDWDDFVQSRNNEKNPPQAIAILWNAGSCSAIAAALKERNYVQTNQIDRVLLTRSNFKSVYGKGFLVSRDAATVAAVASKAVMM